MELNIEEKPFGSEITSKRYGQIEKNCSVQQKHFKVIESDQYLLFYKFI